MDFIVSDTHWLQSSQAPVTQINSGERKYSSSRNICDYIVVHYTGGSTASSAHNTFKAPGVNVSWHLTIGRDGQVYQLHDFRKTTWHAGRSSWNGISGMNRWSIGIELIAAGPLTIKNGGYYTWFNKRIPEEEVYLDSMGKAWHDFTPIQKTIFVYLFATNTK